MANEVERLKTALKERGNAEIVSLQFVTNSPFIAKVYQLEKLAKGECACTGDNSCKKCMAQSGLDVTQSMVDNLLEHINLNGK